MGENTRKMKPFYRSILDGLLERGIPSQLRLHDHETSATAPDEDDWFHIFDHGRVRHERALNAGIAYVYPFWNLDPWGIRAFSSISQQAFDATQVDAGEAEVLFRRLRHRLVKKRGSRYPQPEFTEEALPDGAISVFLQSEFHRDVDETCYLSRREMTEAVLEASGGAPVIVKPHPRDLEVETFQWLEKLLQEYPNLTVSSGNMHDILAVSQRVVTINSAVGIEALLYDLPVTLCGHADFLHLCTTARTVAELEASLQVDTVKRDVKAYLYWYFRMKCLAAGDPDLCEKFLQRVAETGFHP